MNFSLRYTFNFSTRNGFALYCKIILAMFMIATCLIQSLYARNESTHANDNNAIFNIESFVSRSKQNLQYTSEDVTEAKRRLACQFLNLGILYAENEEYAEAKDWIKKAAELYLELNDEYYYYALVWQCHVYRLSGISNEYKSVKNELKQAIFDDKISNDEIRLLVLSRYGEILREEGEIEKAVLVAERCLNNAGVIYGVLDLKNFSYLYKLCSLYLEQGNLKKTKDIITRIKALDLKSQVDKTHYYSSILLESYWLQSSGRIGDMIQLLENNANDIENHYDYFEIKSNMFGALGAAFSSVGDFKKAQMYNEKALEVDKMLYGENSPNYATSLINLSEMYAVNGLLNQSLNMVTKALQIFEELYGKKNEKYINCLEKLASRYSYNNPQKSKELYHECMLLWESLYGQNSRQYAEALICSNLDFSLNPSLKAIANVKRGIDILKSLELTNYEFYHIYLDFYCHMLYMIKDFSNLYTAASELLNISRNHIYYNLLIMPESQRESLWLFKKSNLERIEQYATNHSQFAIGNNDYSLISKYSGLCYNVRLLKKGLLLTSARSIEDIISKSDNQDLNQLIAEISVQRNKLSTLQPGSDEYEQIERTVNNSERGFLELISSYGDFMNFTSIKWKDIQDVLMPGEVAIEFFSFPCQNDKQYGMTFIGSEGEPIALNIFVESELDKYLNDDTTIYDYYNPGLYKTIWSVLEEFSDIKNAHTIYFSADGRLNTIAIENLCDSLGHLACEKRNIIRLSSTRELLHKKSHMKESIANNRQTPIVLYGGLDYNSLLPNSVLDGTSNSPLASTAGLPTAQRAFKNQAQYLQGTLKEVEILSQQLKSANITLYTGSDGTEQSFYDLPNKHPHIIHIATHGFYYDEGDNSSIANSSDEGSNSISMESRAMKESGLLLSGANHILLGEEVADEHNDGILTAEEISTISLGDVDLVVLSACETGLGSISDEGVFGLQRGFKLSGVNCIMMSLWKVNDDATKELMISFYEGFRGGLSKIEALRKAQKKVRETPGFEDPEYWAGFILLDGLN